MSKPEQSELSELLRRNNTATPERADREALRRHYDAHPPGTWSAGLAHLAYEGALSSFKNGAVEETTRAAAERLRAELGNDSTTTLEALAVDHLVLCWVSWSGIAYSYGIMTAQGLTLAHAEYWERRLTAAQGRYIRALATLARLRRLKLPALQLNIGANQVNVSA